MLKGFVNALKEYSVILKLWLCFILLGLASRVLLSTFFTESYSADILVSYLYGIRMDTIVFSAIAILFSITYATNRVIVSKVIFTLFFFVYLSIEISGFFFFQEFFARPNYLFIEHLKHYEELSLMIWECYSIYLTVAIPFVVFSMIVVYKVLPKIVKKGALKPRLALLPLIIVILFIGVRSSLDSSTPNQGYYTFSNSNVHNEIANNSIFSILYAKYSLEKEKFYEYGKISSKEAIDNVKLLTGIENNTQNLVRSQKSEFPKKKNVILVILESFGHEHVGYLGGTPTTPNLDSLTKESLYFTNLYATGSRTSWGVSSILTSLYPLPTREYVKAAKSQKDFYTVAKTFKRQDYKTEFLYSGDVDFDNMRGFFLSNGYDNVMGKEDFGAHLQKYTWGYCDEDLYSKAVDLLEASDERPLFLTLLTMSSHEPFDYPRGKVEPYKEAKLDGFANAIKYADYAIGKFIKELKDKGFMENTVVAFIADHNNNAYGKFDVPIDKYKIPALIVSKEFEGGKEYNKIASQIDIAPTLLDVAGISDTIPTMGESIFKNERNSAILLAQKKNFAYMLPDKFIIYKKKK